MTIITHLTPERPDDAEIAAFENTIEGTLPVDYKLFLKSDNGGRPRERLFRLATRNGGSEEGLIDYFFALHAGRIGSLKRTWASYNDQLPAGHLPIAADSFGNLIVLKLGGPKPGQVYFWDHEGEEDSPAGANLSPIAGSFAEFIVSLAVEVP
ncbi:MAG: putative glucan synthasis protein [Chthoniobacteraceae bacterium]|nr:putative glucan synthasis protein [Chthoniobacteraceae bacterium]